MIHNINTRNLNCLGTELTRPSLLRHLVDLAAICAGVGNSIQLQEEALERGAIGWRKKKLSKV